jgi:hypothetical protein
MKLAGMFVSHIVSPWKHLPAPWREVFFFWLSCHHSLAQVITFLLFLFGATAPPPQWARASSFTKFLDHTQWCATVCRTPLGERSARRRDLYLTTHNTYNRQTSMRPAGFESTVSAGERLQTHVLDRAATGTGIFLLGCRKYYYCLLKTPPFKSKPDLNYATA